MSKPSNTRRQCHGRAWVCSEYIQYCEQGLSDGTLSQGHRESTVAYLNALCEYCGAMPVSQLKKGHVNYDRTDDGRWQQRP